jgi:hypothetical protein
MRNIHSLLFLLLFFNCKDPKGKKPDYFAFEKGEKLAELTNEKIEEASGLAASIKNAGHLWTHNDSGNDAEVFLIDQTLNIKLTCKLLNVDNRDWEDIAVGQDPDSGKTFIYVADIGDNLGRYPYKMIYRFEEPLLNDSISEIVINDFDTLVVQLPDVARDAETLMVDPLSNDLLIVSKRKKPVVIYRISKTNSLADTVTAEVIGTLNIKGVVGGDISEDGKEILIKNSKNVFYWQVEGSIEETLKKQPKILEYKQEPQGEAIAFARDGSGYFTLSEKVSGERSYLQFYKRKQTIK